MTVQEAAPLAARRALLGDAVRSRRATLALSARAAAGQSGVDPRTLARLERGEAVQLRPERLDALDRALAWAPGASRAVLAGSTDDPVAYLPEAPAEQPSETELLLRLVRSAAETARLGEQLLRSQVRP